MADFLVALGIVGFALAMLGLIWALDPGMTLTQGILLGIAVVLFLYLGYAMFKPEKF